MARERQPREARDAKVAQERRARLQRERERQRAAAAAAKAARPARPARPTKAAKGSTVSKARPVRAAAASSAAAREQHEGLVGWVARTVRELPGRIADGLLGFVREVGGVLAGVGLGIVRLIPGGRLVLRLVSRTRDGKVVAGSARAAAGSDAPSWGSGGRVVREQPTEAARAAAARRRALLMRRMRVAALILGAVVVGVGSYVVPRLDVFRVGHVEIVGASAVGDLDVRERTDSLLAGKTIFTVDEAAVTRRLEALPFVRSVQVERHLPDGLGIRIVEYRPLALACTAKACWLVSPDGRILTKVAGDEWRGRVPVVRLDTTAKVRPGMRMPQEPGLALLLAVPSDSTLSIAAVDVASYSVVATTSDGVELRFGRAERWAAKLAVARRLIDNATRKHVKLAYVDVSVPGVPATCTVDDVSCRDAPTTTEIAAAHAAKRAALTHIKQLQTSGAAQSAIDEATFRMNHPPSSKSTGTPDTTPNDAFEAATRSE